jgi:filamentous hemagglutinin
MLAMPSQALQNLIVQGTGGANSPYSWGSPSPGATAPGAPANPVGAEDTNPRFYTCASADCLLYGANRNSANPQNMAEDRNVNIKLAAAGMILGAPLAVAAGGPPLAAIATTAQTVPLAGGLPGCQVRNGEQQL